MPDGSVTFSGPFPWETTSSPPPPDPNQDQNQPAALPAQPFPWEQQPSQDSSTAQQPATGPPTPLVPSSPQPAPPATAPPTAPAPTPVARVTQRPPGVDPELHAAMASAFAEILPQGYTARITSGVRSNNPASQHYLGHAEDWQIYDPQGNPINNRGPDISGYYHAAAVQALLNLHYIDPQKAQEFAWGNYFETSKGSGTRDIMHYDIGGPRASPGFGDPLGIYREAANLRARFQTPQAQPAAAPPPAAAPAATPSQAPLPSQPFPFEQPQAQASGTQDATSQTLPKQPFPFEQQTPTPQNTTQQTTTQQVPQVTLPDVNVNAALAGEGATPQDQETAEMTMPGGGGILGSIVSGAAQGAVTTAGQIAAGPGNLVTGAGAQMAAHMQGRVRQQLSIMQAIDDGTNPHIDSTDAEQQQFASDYINMTPDQRANAKAEIGQQILDLPPAAQTPLATGAKAVGETIAAPGDWVDRQGQKITPPPGYENSLSNEIGKTVGAVPVYLATLWAGGLPAVVGAGGAQAYTQAYNEQLKNGVAPEDAAANASIKALADAGLMAVPVARWAETITGAAKRALAAAATRMATDGVIMTSVSQATQLVNNIIDKATTEPEKSVTEGVGEPKALIAQTVAGMVPGGVEAGKTALGVSRGEAAGRPAGEGQGAAPVAGEPQAAEQPAPQPTTPSVPGGEAAAPGAEPAAAAAVPREPAPAPDQGKVAAGIGTPPAPEEGGTLVRTTDSSGNDWIGHAGVLVKAGQNPAVDNTFREAEQSQPVSHGNLQDTKAIDDLVTSAHVSATQGITWTDTTEAPDGRAVVVGHDAEGHAVELPEERYAVLAQYGDPNSDTYLASKPGEPPIVAVRDPDTQTVQAIAQGRAPLPEPNPDHLTFEEQDEARQAGVPAEGPEAQPAEAQGPEFYAQPPRTARQPQMVSPDITDRPSLYRQAFRDAGYDPDVAVNKPIGEQQQILQKHIADTYGFNVEVDPRMQPQKAVDSLLDAYRNMQWMAHSLGYPIKAMSLGGKLKLRLEPWTPKKPYLGMYSWDPTTNAGTIHMPDRSNSFAHEWTHALDHELVNKLANNPVARGQLLSSRTREGGLDINAKPPGNAEEAFARVINSIFHDNALLAARIHDLNAKAQGTGADARRAAAEAQRLLAGAKPKQPIGPTEFRRGAVTQYHAMPEELLARAHEAYVANLVAKNGGGNEFITKGDAAYLSRATQRFNDLYPHGPDRDAIFRAFQDLHAQLIKDQTLGPGPAARRPGDYDILDPIHWKYVGSPQSNPQVTAGLRQAVTRSTSWWQRQLQGMGERAGATGPARLRPTYRDVLRWKDAITPLIHSNMGQLDVYRERYEKAGNHAVAHILSGALDKLGWRSGEGRLQATPFERLADEITSKAVNKVDNIMNANGMPTSRLNVAAEKQLWDALRGRDDQGNTPQVPPNVQRAAGEIRAVLNDFWYRIERSGVSVGMPRDEAYVPIVYDEHAILADGQKAHDTIANAMTADFDVKQRQSNNSFIHEAYDEIPRRDLPKDVHDDMAELARTQEAMRAESDPGKLAALDHQQGQLLDKLVPTIRDAWAQRRAGDWVFALNDVPWGPEGRSGSMPSSNPLKSRVLSAEARDILSPYIVTQPSELLPYYFHSMGRKLAFAQTFGAKGEVLDRIMRDLMTAGASKQDRIEIKSSIESALGMMRSNEITVGHRFGVWGRSLATMALMGRSTWSTIGEPMVVAAQTKSAKAAAQTFSTSMQALLREINLTRGSERVQHLSDIANVLGITSTRMKEAMLTGRTQALVSSPGRTMANFYRRIGLTQTTNANKIGAVQGAHTAMQIWGRQILAGRRGALFDPHGEFRELGIPNAEHEEFSRWINDLDHLPTLDEITSTPMGQRWGDAIRRFNQKTVLEPTAAEKPRAANSALGRFVYGLMSYNYAFQRAVLNPAFDRLSKTVAYEQQRYGKVGGAITGTAKWGAYATAAIGAMMAVQIPVSILRQEIFDHSRAEQWRQDGTYWDKVLGLAFQRTGIGGVADPLVNAITGLRYEHDLSSLALGAQANFWVQALKDAVSPFVAGSPDTNTAAYRSVRGWYQLLGMPIAATATALLPGGPYASWMISLLLGQYATSMSAADRVAQLIEGPKGTKTNLTPAQQRLEYLKSLQPKPRQAATKQESGNLPSAGLLGLVDDFALPLVKWGSRVASRFVH